MPKGERLNIKVYNNSWRNIRMTDKNIIAGAPTEEPARQQYFMEQVKKLVEAESAKKGRPLTCFINTFGCQMHPEPVTA